jgi:phage-related protein
MVHRDLVSARNRNSCLYKHRSNVRTTFIKQQQVNYNGQNNTLSYAQAVTGVPADATNNNNHNSTDITTQLTTFLSEFKNIFSRLLNMFSQLLRVFSQLINVFSQLLSMFGQLLNMFGQPFNQAE